MVRVLVTDSLHASGVALLRAQGREVEVLPPDRREQLAAYASRADALIVRTATQVTGELLDAAPRVRVVGRAGAGLDNIDVEAARARGVEVVSAPDANAVSAAEHTFGLLLSVARSIASADSALKAGRWQQRTALGTELAGLTLGVVGFGRIGQRVARRARAFDMRVLVNDPVIDRQAVEEIGVEVVAALDDMLPRIDCLTLHVPLDETTRHLIGASELKALPSGALLINCARGGVVDEEALFEALEAGSLQGAGIDVFSEEPPTDRRLAQHARVVATPHLGAHTHAAKEKVALEVAANVLAALARAAL